VTYGTLVDSNVLLDVLTEDATWVDWSTHALIRAAETGPLFINPIIFGEVSVRFSRIEDLDDAFPASDCRRNKGTRNSTLPDFFIGAHAAISDLDLLTRDEARYRTYFPSVHLTTPPR